MDEPGVELAQAGAGKAQPVEHAGTVGFEHRVGAPEQALERPLAVAGLEVDLDHALAPVHGLVPGRDTVGIERPHGAQRLAAGGLDLDHAGAEIGQNLAAVGSGRILAEIDDAVAGEERLGHDGTRPFIYD